MEIKASFCFFEKVERNLFLNLGNACLKFLNIPHLTMDFDKVILGLSILGTLSFAISGFIKVVTKKLDLFTHCLK